jgi:hypothetical protein
MSSEESVTRFPAHSTDASDWQPIWPEVPIPKEDIVKGSWEAGRIHWLRFDDSRDVDLPLQACVHYTNEDVTIRVEIHADEFIYVIEGEFTIELDDGPTHTFKAGDAVHFKPGLSGLWTYKAPFRQFVSMVYTKGGVAERTEVHAR